VEGAVALIDRLLGPIEAAVDGRMLDLGGMKVRALLCPPASRTLAAQVPGLGRGQAGEAD
jgi:hypothetical protein